MPEPDTNKWREPIALVLFMTMICVVVGGGLIGIATWLYVRNHDPYSGVSLQAGVSYVTSRKWPGVEWQLPAGPYLRWLQKKERSIALEPSENAANLMAGKEITVLVHGYQSPPRAVSDYFRGLIDHLQNDGHYRGALVVYDWPSVSGHWSDPDVQFARGLSCDGPCRGGMADMIGINRAGFESQMYQIDRRIAEQEGVPALVALLKTIQDKFEPSAINVIAHSMGARVTIASLTQHTGTIRLRRLVLLAPDIEVTSMLDPKIRAALQAIEAIHVYFSRHDEALSYSEIVNRGSSLGRQGPDKPDNFPPNVHFHDVTSKLGAENAHGGYVTRDGAAKINLSESLD